MGLRGAAAAFFEYIERHNIKDFSDLPPEILSLWLNVKTEQRLSVVSEIANEEKNEDLGNVIHLKKKFKRASL